MLDSQTDWRFANNMPSAVLGARFYAGASQILGHIRNQLDLIEFLSGVPLLAPAFGDPNATPVALGTLCIIDDQPHETFTASQRQSLCVTSILQVLHWHLTEVIKYPQA